MKIYSDDYYTVVAKDREQAIKYFIDNEFTDEECLNEIHEVNPDKKKMWFPINELPEEYHNEIKYPQKDWCGEYIGVQITLAEALRYRKEEKPPFVICVSSELM